MRLVGLVGCNKSVLTESSSDEDIDEAVDEAVKAGQYQLCP